MPDLSRPLRRSRTNRMIAGVVGGLAERFRIDPTLLRVIYVVGSVVSAACADGGNPDPTLTSGKNPQRAKEVELKGWHYPRHLAGRVFSVVVHGDAVGAETLRRSLTDWLTDMGLIAAGRLALVDGYVGYYKAYATSHDELDEDKDFQEEVRNAARSLITAVRLLRRGELKQPDASLREPRPK